MRPAGRRFRPYPPPCPVAMCVDLHTHSIFSDGSLTPAELIELAVRQGLTGIALTDHDTVEGVRELCRLGQQVGITVITGVEISTTLRQYTLHILGYGIDPDNPELHEWLAPLQHGRERRNTLILEKLQALGVDIPSQYLSMLPYVATIVVLALISRNATTIRLNAPASLGKPFHPDS